jgi:hypothetical protein
MDFFIPPGPLGRKWHAAQHYCVGVAYPEPGQTSHVRAAGLAARLQLGAAGGEQRRTCR